MFKKLFLSNSKVTGIYRFARLNNILL